MVYNERRQLEDEHDCEEAEAIAAALYLRPDELNQIEYTIHEIATTTGWFTDTA
ncbi:hypothetical protein BEL01nite_82520 [Bradyrhizobium elkanii]|nr:hypothetical protein BEL01nite_82520 [Bradyrhizobium elkanii]